MLGRHLGGTYPLTWHSIFLARPLIEINQLAPFRTERPPFIVFPLDRFSTGGTSRHKQKVKRMPSKVKRDIQSTLVVLNKRSSEGVE
jgi:hypothetical protein